MSRGKYLNIFSQNQEMSDGGGHRVADSGRGVASSGHRVEDGGHRVVDGGHRVVDSGRGVASSGHRVVDSGWGTGEAMQRSGRTTKTHAKQHPFSAIR